MRLNSHQQHLEDLVFLYKENGLQELLDKVNNLDKMKYTLKIDGSPAVVCWHTYPGLPNDSICLKSFMSKNPKVLSSIEDIKNKYTDPILVKKLAYCLELAKSIPDNEAWQGDCLFTDDTLDISPERIRFRANKLIYEITHETEGMFAYDKINGKKFGIYFHTVYEEGFGTQQSFDIDLNKLNNVSSDIFVSATTLLTASLEFAGFKVSLFNFIINSISNTIKLILKATNDCTSNFFMLQPNVSKYWSQCVNSYIREKNDDFLSRDMKEYMEDFINKKTDKNYKGQQKSFLRLILSHLGHICDKDCLFITLSLFNECVALKQVIMYALELPKINVYIESTEDGIIPAEHEGFTMIDEHNNIVKLVNRSKFSVYNNSDKFIRNYNLGAWDDE